MSFVPKYIFILALTISVDYTAALFIEKSEGKKRKIYLIVSILTTVAILFFFKYFNFFNSNVETIAHALHWNYSISALKVILPIGLSFHTFQSLSYVIEVYKGNQKTEKHFGIYALYVMFYPQLVAGPIERPQNILHQFREHYHFNGERVRSGLLRMLWGLFKKVVIADRLSFYVNQVFMVPGHSHGLTVIVAVIFFAYQIYCDFSGYSDIAIGAAEVMGFKLMTNFNRPYGSQNLSDFWRRWHISLSTWFRDYLYIPLGGNRVALPRLCFNLLCVFVVSGLWHGAGWTFVTWGALHGLALIYEVLTRKLRKTYAAKIPGRYYGTISTVFTFAFTCLAWIFFRANTIEGAFTIIKNIFVKVNFFRAPFGTSVETMQDMAIVVMTLPLMLFMEKKYGANPLGEISANRSRMFKWITAWAGIFIILAFGSFLNSHTFIYFQF